MPFMTFDDPTIYMITYRDTYTYTHTHTNTYTHARTYIDIHTHTLQVKTGPHWSRST